MRLRGVQGCVSTHGYLSGVAGTLALVSIMACSATELPPVYGETPIDASLIKVIADPGQFDHRIVRMIGYCVIEFEGNALYLHREDYEQGITKNGIWLALPEQLPPERKELAGRVSEKYCLVEGRIAAGATGHMGGWSAEIGEITRLDFWSSGAEHAGRLKPPPPPPSATP